MNRCSPENTELCAERQRKVNEEETETRGRVTDRQELGAECAGLCFILFVISTVYGHQLLICTLIMTLRYMRYLTELATLSLSAQQTEN